MVDGSASAGPSPDPRRALVRPCPAASFAYCSYRAAHAVFGTIYDVGDALGPIAAGLLVASVGSAHMFQIMAGVALTAAVMFSMLSRGTIRRHEVVSPGTAA